MPVKKKAPAKVAPKRAAGKPVTQSRPAVKPKKSTSKGPPSAPATPSPRAPLPTAASESRAQYAMFERAIKHFHKRDFRQAREWFVKAIEGPAKEVAAKASTHIKMCDQRLAAPPPAPRSLEEHYTYGVALINARSLAAAREHLETALKMDAKADHVHYALAVCLGLSGDVPGAYDSLKRAIELQPRNRMAARQDSDFEELSRRPPFHRLLYPEN